jgi:replicative DNA helicase
MNQPPHDEDAERAVLGCALRSAEALAGLQVLVQPSDFYNYAHRKIWESMTFLTQRGQPVDPVTLWDRIVVQQLPEEIGGAAYIAHLWDHSPALVGHYKAHALVLRGLAVRRAFAEAAVAIETMAHDRGMDAQELIEKSEMAMFQASRRHHGLTEAVTLQQAIADSADDLDRLKRLRQNDGDLPLPMGWPELDAYTGGFQREELTVLGARPSVGKTVFCMNVIEYLAGLGKRVFFASIEQSYLDVAKRFLCRHAKLSMVALRNARISEAEGQRLVQAMAQGDNLDVSIDSCGNQTAAHIASQARRLAMKKPLDLIAVDYLGLIEPEDRKMQRYVQVGQNCQRMKQLAKELNVPVLLLAQVGRDSENRRPNLSDLRESGDIEQHADCVLMLHRGEEPDRTQASEPLEVLILKQRNGPLGEVKLLHFKRHFDLQPFSVATP